MAILSNKVDFGTRNIIKDKEAFHNDKSDFVKRMCQS